MNLFNLQIKKFQDLRVPEEFDLHDAGLLIVYCIRVSDFNKQDADLIKYLNRNEILKSKNYRKQTDTLRYIVTRAVLRILLAQFLKKHPLEMEFYTENNLKPRVNTSGEPLHFNVSHAGDLIMISICSEPVGIDIEFIDNAFRYDLIMDLVFDPEEIGFIKTSANKREAFYTLWTRKEALLKAIGKGIDDDVRSISSFHRSTHIFNEFSKLTEDLSVHTFTIDEKFIASLAFHSDYPISQIPIHRLGLELFQNYYTNT